MESPFSSVQIQYAHGTALLNSTQVVLQRSILENMESKSLAELVRRRLVESGMSQRVYADHIGMSPSHINQMVKGKIALPSADVRRKLAEDLGLSHLDILIAAGEITREEAESGGIQQRDNLSTIPEPVVTALNGIETWSSWHVDQLLRAVAGVKDFDHHLAEIVRSVGGDLTLEGVIEFPNVQRPPDEEST